MEQKKREERLLEACLDQETNGVMTAPVSLILPPKPKKSLGAPRIMVMIVQNFGTVLIPESN